MSKPVFLRRTTQPPAPRSDAFPALISFLFSGKYNEIYFTIFSLVLPLWGIATCGFHSVHETSRRLIKYLTLSNICTAVKARVG